MLDLIATAHSANLDIFQPLCWAEPKEKGAASSDLSIIQPASWGLIKGIPQSFEEIFNIPFTCFGASLEGTIDNMNATTTYLY